MASRQSARLKSIIIWPLVLALLYGCELRRPGLRVVATPFLVIATILMVARFRVQPVTHARLAVELTCGIIGFILLCVAA